MKKMFKIFGLPALLASSMLFNQGCETPSNESDPEGHRGASYVHGVIGQNYASQGQSGLGAFHTFLSWDESLKADRDSREDLARRIEANRGKSESEVRSGNAEDSQKDFFNMGGKNYYNEPDTGKVFEENRSTGKYDRLVEGYRAFRHTPLGSIQIRIYPGKESMADLNGNGSINLINEVFGNTERIPAKQGASMIIRFDNSPNSSTAIIEVGNLNVGQSS